MNNSSKHLEQNVHGWERAMSLAGGLYFLARVCAAGPRRPAATGHRRDGRCPRRGHCEAKRVFNEVSEQAGMAEGRSHHMPFERYDSNKGSNCRPTPQLLPTAPRSPATTI